jgi:LmbE family N-acetylglucosaminyl deacetylase
LEQLEPVERALVVTPHPDDAEFGCSGTVARLIQAGKEVCYLVATNGDKGGRDSNMTAEYLIDARQKEQRRAADILGVSEVVFLDFGDGELEDDHAFRRQLVYHIRRLKPNIVFTTDPFRTSFYIHRDHRITGLVTIDAVFPYARDRLHYPEHIAEGMIGHNVEEVFFWGSEAPDTFIDVGDVMDLKIKSLLAHTSQVQDWVREAGGEEAFGDQMKAMSQKMMQKHKAPFEHAEAFRRYGLRRMAEEMDSESQA